MRYFSTRDKAKKHPFSFSEAVFKGLAPDKGLFMPENIPALPPSFFDGLCTMSLSETGRRVLYPFMKDEISEDQLHEIIEETLNFPIPLNKVSSSSFALELYHGPTFAFKDVGARFLARCMSHFSSKDARKTRVLVATSGDTGSAVAQGFYKVPGIEVVILYPAGKISRFQEQQMTTLGGNITALEIDGTFDDCQRMVKEAFADSELNENIRLTSANSINIARLLPQSIYYYHAVAQWQEMGMEGNPVISVPSGNYGNLSAGLIAAETGLQVAHFLACSNINDTVPDYLNSGKYHPKDSRQTISNAMDVGDPSNFERMLHLFGGSYEAMKKTISGYSFTDRQTRDAIVQAFSEENYILDPHGAVGYLGLKDYIGKNGGKGIFLETAHPYKFKTVVEEETGEKLKPVTEFGDKTKKSFEMQADYSSFRSFLTEMN